MADPILTDEWQTDEIRAALAQIQSPHLLKKHVTLIRVAFAVANGDAVAKVLERDDTCADTVWYGNLRRNGTQKVGWRDVPEIKAAYDLVLARALEWRDRETLEIEAASRQKRLRAIAVYSANAPKALYDVAAGDEQRGADRINAAMKLIGLAEPNAQAGLFIPVGASTDMTQQVNVGDDAINAKIEQELARLAGGAPAGDVEGAPEPADAGE